MYLFLSATRLGDECVKESLQRLDLERLDAFGELKCKLWWALDAGQVYGRQVLEKLVTACGIERLKQAGKLREHELGLCIRRIKRRLRRDLEHKWLVHIPP